MLITGTPSERATRSAVRWRVPVSLVGNAGSGRRCTLARAMRSPSDDRMIAPSILASSLRRCGVNGRSSGKPPEQIASTSGPSPTTTSAPIFARTTRSTPARSGVPGATLASASRRSELAAGRKAPDMGEVYGRAVARQRGIFPRQRSLASGARAPGAGVDRGDGQRLGQRGGAQDAEAGHRRACTRRARRRGRSRGGRPRPGDGRRGPPCAARRPDRPRRTRRGPGGTGVSTRAEATAMQMPRSAPGSPRRTPPTADA